MGKAKALLELNFAMDIKGNMKGFYRYVSDERKTVEIVGPLQEETRDLIIWYMKKVEVRNDFFVSVFSGKSSSHTVQVSEG